MTWLRLFFDPTGRIGRRAFVLSMTGLYALWLLVPLVPSALVSDLLVANFRLGTQFPPLGLLQTLLPPYVCLCLHLKRLRDAGRGPGSLIGMIVFSFATILVAVAFGSWFLHDQLPVKNLNYAAIWIFVIGAGIIAWPIYGVWVALGESKSPPLRDDGHVAAHPE